MSKLDVGQALGKQVGPFPVGVWLVIVGGGLWFGMSRKGSDTVPDAAPAPTTDEVASPDNSDYQGGGYGGGGGGGGYLGDGSLPGFPVPTSPSTPTATATPTPIATSTTTVAKRTYTVPAGGMSVWDAARKFLPWMPLDKGATTMITLNPSSPARITHRFYGGEVIRVEL